MPSGGASSPPTKYDLPGACNERTEVAVWRAGHNTATGAVFDLTFVVNLAVTDTS